MFNSKKLLLSISILITIGGLLFIFSSASTLDRSNGEAIDDLYKTISTLQEKVDVMESQGNPNWSEPTIGQVSIFAGNFAPQGWAFCDGQLLSISEHTALFSILGTNFGGDGRTTFGLPDLDGRVPLHVGSHKSYSLGQKGRVRGTRNEAATENSKSIRYLGLNYIIALQGTFPSRN